MLMKYGLSIAGLLLFMTVAQAQLFSDFSSTSYPTSPLWHGHTFAFGLQGDTLLRSQTLQSTYISTANSLGYAVMWEFGGKLYFNLSPSNR